METTMTIPLLVSVIIAFNQLMKNAGLPTKYIPLISMILGIGAGFFFLPGVNIQETIFNGIAIGLGSNGLFDFAKSTIVAPKYYKVVQPEEGEEVEDKTPIDFN